MRSGTIEKSLDFVRNRIIIGPMIILETKEDVEPLCPHCERELQSVWMRELKAILGRRYIYFCPHCRKVLGISHRKGFWMG